MGEEVFEDIAFDVCAKLSKVNAIEFISDLERRAPVYIIVIENDATGVEPVDSYTQMQSFPEFKRMIDDAYVLETKIEDYFIYRGLDERRGRL